MNHEDRLEFQKPNEYERYRYLLNDGRKHRLAIIIPGGGFYIVADYLEGKPIAQKMNENGISAVTVRYRVREKAAFPAPLDDVAAAIDEALRRAEEWNLEELPAEMPEQRASWMKMDLSGEMYWPGGAGRTGISAGTAIREITCSSASLPGLILRQQWEPKSLDIRNTGSESRVPSRCAIRFFP